MTKLHPVWVINIVLLLWILANSLPNLHFETYVFKPNALLPDGSQYFGEILNGKPHGNGKLLYLNQDEYIGGFKKGLFHGKGVFNYRNGDQLEAQFKAGFANGQGKLTYTEGGYYKGEFKDGYFNGQGTLYYRNGTKYTGHFSEGIQHGLGKYTYANGEIYDGSFENAELVFGIHIDSNGNTYNGEFKHSLYHGEGKFTKEDGSVFLGQFDAGFLEGEGEHYLADGSYYQGQFKSSLYHGQGKYTTTDKKRYEGEFEYGLYHGAGKYTYKNREGELITQEGQWKWGKYIDENRDSSENTNLTADSVLYNQNNLLDTHLKLVTENDQAHNEIYFLGVAGDGSQEVFLREINEVKQSISKIFSIEDKELLLINHVKTSEKFPLATYTSLEIAINNIANKMDIEKDVLFLYMTSHGSKDHVFYINDERFDLNGISATELSNMLDKSKIKWRIIMISACFSGGFLDLLKNENSLIMTSARADRASFGCSNESDMTYFGKAFFREALPHASTLSEAFELSLSHIKEWEIELGVDDHSEPQIFVGKRIESHLSYIYEQQNN